jgi:hypothetical protein
MVPRTASALTTAGAIPPISLTPPFLTPTIASGTTRAPVIRATRSITARGTITVLRVRAPLTTPATLISTVIVVRSQCATVAGDVFGAHHPHRNEIPEHLLLEGNQRVTRKNEPIVLLKEVVGFLDDESLSLREKLDAVGPRHNLQPPQVFPARRRRPQLLNPRQAEHGGDRRLIARMDRHPGELEVRADPHVLPHSVELPTPWREAQGEVSPVHDAGRHHFIPDLPAAAND